MERGSDAALQGSYVRSKDDKLIIISVKISG